MYYIFKIHFLRIKSLLKNFIFLNFFSYKIVFFPHYFYILKKKKKKKSSNICIIVSLFFIFNTRFTGYIILIQISNFIKKITETVYISFTLMLAFIQLTRQISEFIFF